MTTAHPHGRAADPRARRPTTLHPRSRGPARRENARGRDTRRRDGDRSSDAGPHGARALSVSLIGILLQYSGECSLTESESHTPGKGGVQLGKRETPMDPSPRQTPPPAPQTPDPHPAPPAGPQAVRAPAKRRSTGRVRVRVVVVCPVPSVSLSENGIRSGSRCVAEPGTSDRSRHAISNSSSRIRPRVRGGGPAGGLRAGRMLSDMSYEPRDTLRSWQWVPRANAPYSLRGSRIEHASRRRPDCRWQTSRPPYE